MPRPLHPVPVLALILAAALATGCSSPPAAATARAHPWLGSNVANRERVERSVVAQVLLYIPDRVLDMLDVFSFDVHVGLGALANVHVTRAVQAGAGLREVLGFGWHERRSLGFRNQGDANLLLPALGAEAVHVGALGTSGLDAHADGNLGLIGPGDDIYQEYRDYWGVGAQVTVGIVGFDFDFHPVQLADFFLGWGTVDILKDDFAGTRGGGGAVPGNAVDGDAADGNRAESAAD